MPVSKNCHVIAVTGGKGGVGKSVFSANFSIALAMELRKKVLLIDLDDNSCGDQNVILGIKPSKTAGEIAKYTGAINPQTIQGLVNKHPLGIYYLAAVKNPGERVSIPTESFLRQLDQFSKLFDFIICDLGSSTENLQLAVMSEASAILTLTTPEILAVNQTKRLMNDIVANTLPVDLLQVIVNKSSSAGLNPQVISKTLRRPVIGSLPQDDITTASSLQRNTPFINPQAKTPLAAAYRNTVRALIGSGVLQKNKALSKPKPISLKKETSTQSNNLSQIPSDIDDPRTLLKLRVHNGLIQEMDLQKGITDTDGDPAKEEQLRMKTQQVITQILDKEQAGIPRDERSRLIKEILDEALGLGPLEDLLEDDNVSEIMVNGPKMIYAERNGRLSLTDVTFTSNLQLKNVIERIVTPLGRRIDEKTPYVDARLQDGSRVNAVIEPIALDGASLTIRKFKKDPITPNHYIKWGSLTQSMVDFLRICVENGLNVIISGGTGSGKTTLLNVLSSFIPSSERIITVEDAAELNLGQDHVVRLETRPPNMEGSGAITIRDLVRNTLRMRPDRIVVGECRGGEALDMLSAMNTGHDGSMTTVHANTPREAISRLETLCMMADAGLPVKAIREQIAGAVDLIIQQSRLSDGSRKVISITEVIGMQGETISLQEIFRFKETGFDKNRKIIGQFQAMGLIPTFIEEFERKGIKIPRTLFTSEPANRQVSNRPTKKVSGGK